MLARVATVLAVRGPILALGVRNLLRRTGSGPHGRTAPKRHALRRLGCIGWQHVAFSPFTRQLFGWETALGTQAEASALSGREAHMAGLDWVIYFAVFVVVIVLVWYLLQQLPLPPPANQFIQIAIVVLVAVVVVVFLLSLTGGGGGHIPRLR